jgi:hypothetical protein
MSHAIWAQRTPRMAYNMQGITMFHVAWKRGWSPVGLTMLRGWAFCSFGWKFNIYIAALACAKMQIWPEIVV